MTIRQGEAEWEGSLKEGAGRLSLGSGAFHGPYSFPSRFADRPGTNPEELIGAAHAACFSMALAAILGKKGLMSRALAGVASITLKSSLA